MIISGLTHDLEERKVELYIQTETYTGRTLTLGEDGVYLADDPIQISDDYDDTFTVTSQRSCTINLYTDRYLGNIFFAKRADDVKVNIYVDGQIIFAGYVTPNTYSQEYIDSTDSFSLNCTDALSTMQYYNYKNIITEDDYKAVKAQADTLPFSDIMKPMMDKMRDLNILHPDTKASVWYDMSKGKTKDSLKTVFNDLGVSEQVFLGESLDDVKTYDSIFETILEYLNLHIRQVGFDFYIFDWDTIRKQKSKWCNLASENYAEETVSIPKIDLSEIKRGSSDTNLTVGDVYNQISVQCDVNSQDDLVESPFDEDSTTSLYSGKQLYCTEYSSAGSGDRAQRAMNALVQGKPTTYENAREDDWYIQVMHSKNWKFYDGQKRDVDDTIIRDDNGIPYKQYAVVNKVAQSQLSPILINWGHIQHNASATDNAPTSSISMDPYIYISVNGDEELERKRVPMSGPSDEDLKNHEGMIEYTGNKSGGVFSPMDDQTTNYIVINGKMRLQPIVYESSSIGFPVRMNDYQNLKTKGVKKTEDTTYGVPYNFGYHRTISNLVYSEDNPEGKYYSRKFYTLDRPTMKKDDNKDAYLKDGSWGLQPPQDKDNHEGYKYNYSSWDDATDKISKLPVLECELIIGNKRAVEYDIDAKTGIGKWAWVDATSGVPQTYVESGETKTYLKKTFSIGPDIKIGDKIIGPEYNFMTNTDYTMNINTDGIAIPIKRSDAVSGRVHFKILGPVNLVWDNITRRNRFWWSISYNLMHQVLSHKIMRHVQNIILSDFSMKVVTDMGGGDVQEDRDLVYSSDESRNYLSKKDPIDFEIITQLTSQECIEKGIKSSLAINSVTDMQTKLGCGRIYNIFYGDDDFNKSRKAEEYYIDEYYSEYSVPRVLAELDLYDVKDAQKIGFWNLYTSKNIKKTFYPISIGWNLTNSTAHIKLKEL